MSLAGAVDDVLALLGSTGLRVVDTLADVNPPCVYVIPPEGEFRFAARRALITWVAYLVVPGAGARHAVDALSSMVDKLAGVLPATTFTRDAIANLEGGDPYPALRLEWSSTTTIGG